MANFPFCFTDQFLLFPPLLLLYLFIPSFLGNSLRHWILPPSPTAISQFAGAAYAPDLAGSSSRPLPPLRPHPESLDLRSPWPNGPLPSVSKTVSLQWQARGSPGHHLRSAPGHRSSRTWRRRSRTGRCGRTGRRRSCTGRCGRTGRRRSRTGYRRSTSHRSSRTWHRSSTGHRRPPTRSILRRRTRRSSPLSGPASTTTAVSAEDPHAAAASASPPRAVSGSSFSAGGGGVPGFISSAGGVGNVRGEY